MQAITEIDGDNATVIPLNASDRPRLAALLLQAAGPGNARVVRTVSVRGGGRAFEVPTVVATAAGLVPDETAETADSFDSGGFAVAPTTKLVTEPQRVFSPEEIQAYTAAVEFAESQAEAAKPERDDAAVAESEPTSAKRAPAKKAPAKKAAPKPEGGKSDVE